MFCCRSGIGLTTHLVSSPCHSGDSRDWLICCLSFLPCVSVVLQGLSPLHWAECRNGLVLWTVSSIRAQLYPPQPLAHPQLTCCRAEWGTEKALMLRQHCSEITKTSLSHLHRFGHKFKVQHHTVKKANSFPAGASVLLMWFYSTVLVTPLFLPTTLFSCEISS